VLNEGQLAAGPVQGRSAPADKHRSFVTLQRSHLAQRIFLGFGGLNRDDARSIRRAFLLKLL
jgi:hypothetical protein